MAEITEDTSIEELAVIISEALEAAGITATLSGGGALSIYSHNQSMSHDLDFVTSADPKSLLNAIAYLGFVRGSKSGSMNIHARSGWLNSLPAPSGLEISRFQTLDPLKVCRLCMGPSHQVLPVRDSRGLPQVSLASFVMASFSSRCEIHQLAVLVYPGRIKALDTERHGVIHGLHGRPVKKPRFIPAQLVEDMQGSERI